MAPTMLIFLKTIALGQRPGCNKRIGILSEHTHRLSLTRTLKASNNNTLWFLESEVWVGRLEILSLLVFGYLGITTTIQGACNVKSPTLKSCCGSDSE